MCRGLGVNIGAANGSSFDEVTDIGLSKDKALDLLAAINGPDLHIIAQEKAVASDPPSQDRRRSDQVIDGAKLKTLVSMSQRGATA